MISSHVTIPPLLIANPENWDDIASSITRAYLINCIPQKLSQMRLSPRIEAGNDPLAFVPPKTLIQNQDALTTLLSKMSLD